MMCSFLLASREFSVSSNDLQTVQEHPPPFIFHSPFAQIRKMVVDRTSLHYPNVQRCGVVLSGTPSSSSGGGGDSAAGTGPVSLPREVLDAVVPLPPPYSFDTGEERIGAVRGACCLLANLTR